jgi:hypothetical protein
MPVDQMIRHTDHQRVPPLSPQSEGAEDQSGIRTSTGTFAEIGVGQETVRHFFRAGGASQTIAQGDERLRQGLQQRHLRPEPGNRFVCESR